jgi:hypothetical protein
LKLICDDVLSDVALRINLRRYTKAGAAPVDKKTKKEMDTQVPHPTCAELVVTSYDVFRHVQVDNTCDIQRVLS